MHRSAIRKSRRSSKNTKVDTGGRDWFFRQDSSLCGSSCSLPGGESVGKVPASEWAFAGEPTDAREGSEAADGGTDPKISSRLVGKAFPPGGRTKNLRRDRSSSVRRGTN